MFGLFVNSMVVTVKSVRTYVRPSDDQLSLLTSQYLQYTSPVECVQFEGITMFSEEPERFPAGGSRLMIKSPERDDSPKEEGNGFDLMYPKNKG